MKQTAIFPGRYVQAEGSLADLPEEISRLGAKALVIAGETSRNAVLPPFLPEWRKQCPISVEPFGGECCDDEIARLTRVVTEQDCDVVIGVGGGKVIDTAKAVAHQAGARVASVCRETR